MSTKNVTLKEKVNGAAGNVLFPATTTPNVYDSAKSQALSQTLVNTPDYEALGFAKFSTASAYSAGDKVYKDNELYRFIADKAAGEWDVAKVEPWSIEQEIEEVDDAIRSLIPAQASADNKLADKAYVNDKVSTDTATFRGTFNLVSDLHLTTSATQGQIATALGTAISGEDKNDYAFVQIPTSDATPTEIARIDRYKYTGLQWAFEYSLNNSGFTAEQWAAINSGITSSLVTAFGAKYDKPAGGIPASDMNTNTFDDEPTAGSNNLVKSNGVEQMCKKNSEDVFNLNKIDWVYKRSISLTPDRARPIIGHLYKQICTFTIKGNINGNSIVVSGTNVATGNIINLYNNSNPNFPITFQNPRPELNLENITIFLPSTSVSDTFDIEITKDSPFDKITQDQELNVDNDRKLFDDVALISQGITVSLANSSSYQRIDFKQGVKYKLQSNTNTARTISLWSFDKSSMIQNFAISANGIALFTPLSDAFWIKSGDIFSGVLYSEINLPDLQDKINTLKTEDTNNKDDIFSLQNEQSLISEQGLNINLLNNSIYQRVDFKGGNKYKLVSTTNAARTITLWPLDKSSYIQVITVGANKTVLFTANSDASWIKSGDTFTGILYTNSNFKDITEDIDNLENDVALIDGNGINVNLPLPTTYQHVYLKQGRKYLIKSTTNSTRSLTIWPLDKSSAIQVITANANKTVSFIPNADASWIKSGDTFTGVLYDAYNVFVLQDEIDSTNDRIDNIESNDILQSVYQFSRDSDDWIYEETKNCNRDSNTIFLPYLGQQKCHITVSGNVSPNKFKVIATNKETGNQIWLYDGTEGAQLPITFNNPRAEVELLNVGIQIGSQGTTDDITLKIVKESPIAVLKDKVKITSLQQERLKFPMYQFGVGIDIKYETPLCDGFTLPAQLNRVSFFHGLYDQLTTQYPNYITKVDCDSECEAAGIERPSYMEDYPIYMYKFIPPYTPTSGGVDQSTSKSRLKVFIVTGTHPEYMAIYDCYQTMKRICESWQANDNLDALRNEAEYYIIPCSGPWGVDHASRVNYNGVDLNRNAPASNWSLTDNDGYQYSGPEPASEYETKVLVYYMEKIQPQVFIDHHNFADNSKNSIYMSSNAQGGVDVGAAHISAMTRRWKLRFSSVFPNDATIFGFAQITRETGTRGWYGSDAGAWGFTYESSQNLNYTNGELTPSTPHGLSDSTSCTIATDGFLNFLLRVLKTYSEKH